MNDKQTFCNQQLNPGETGSAPCLNNVQPGARLSVVMLLGFRLWVQDAFQKRRNI
jgi:hypothetical protein